jgi:hypothetical protein
MLDAASLGSYPFYTLEYIRDDIEIRVLAIYGSDAIMQRIRSYERVVMRLLDPVQRLHNLGARHEAETCSTTAIDLGQI